jgi:cytochrome c-type biogenesis protein CcmH
MRRRVLRWSVFVVAMLVGSTGIGAAGDLTGQPGVAPASDQTSAEAARLFRDVMSPFCPGLTLADCPSPNAFTLRDDIERRLASGASREAIIDELVAKYGAQILADPSGTPIGSVVWGLPFLLAASALLGLALFLRRATHPHPEDPVVAVAGPPGLQERLEEELERLDEPSIHSGGQPWGR